MKLILLTAPEDIMSEWDTLKEVLEYNLVDYLHIRKDNTDKEYITKIINSLYKKDRPKIILHGHPEIANKYKLGGYHHKSESEYDDKMQTSFQTKAFHSIAEVINCKHPYKYGFLSPIFDSISKKGYPANFNHEELKEFLNSDRKPFPIMALGGVSPDNISVCKELGFDGVAILGTFWKHIFVHKKLDVLNQIIGMIKQHESKIR